MFLYFFFVFNDIPNDKQTFFQDTATPVMTGILDLYDYVCFFLIFIFVLVAGQIYDVLVFFRFDKNDNIFLNRNLFYFFNKKRVGPKYYNYINLFMFLYNVCFQFFEILIYPYFRLLKNKRQNFNQRLPNLFNIYKKCQPESNKDNAVVRSFIKPKKVSTFFDQDNTLSLTTIYRKKSVKTNINEDFSIKNIFSNYVEIFKNFILILIFCETLAFKLLLNKCFNRNIILIKKRKQKLDFNIDRSIEDDKILTKYAMYSLIFQDVSFTHEFFFFALIGWISDMETGFWDFRYDFE